MSDSSKPSSNNGCLVSIGITVLFVILLSQFVEYDKDDNLTNSSWVVCSVLVLGYIFSLLKFTGSSYTSSNSSNGTGHTNRSNDYDIEREFKNEEEQRIQDEGRDAMDHERDNMNI